VGRAATLLHEADSVTTVDAAALLWTDVDFEASLLAARGRLVTLRAA